MYDLVGAIGTACVDGKDGRVHGSSGIWHLSKSKIRSMCLVEGIKTMARTKRRTTRSEQELGILAMKFRGTRDESERSCIEKQYAEVIGRLIRSGAWSEIPLPEDQLPDARMPLAFYQHWSLPVPEGIEGEKLAPGNADL